MYAEHFKTILNVSLKNVAIVSLKMIIYITKQISIMFQFKE